MFPAVGSHRATVSLLKILRCQEKQTLRQAPVGAIMIGGSFLKRTLRNSLVMSKPRCALLVLGLLTLSGCGSECSVFAERCNQQGSGSAITKPTVKSIEITPPNPSLAVGRSM